MTILNTPLLERHKALGARLVDFHGWNMPMQYSSIIDEHMAVREKVGIFDVSHMGEIEIKGEHATELLERLTPNDVGSLAEGRVQYSALLNDRGGVIDDLLIYAVSKKRYFLCVNASNVEKDVSWLADHALQYPDVDVANVSRQYGMISVQGPNAEPLLKNIVSVRLDRLDYYNFTIADLNEVSILISRTGYTGEDGFEIFCDWGSTTVVWDAIFDKGKHFGLTPVGLGARDTLRMEMRYPLHGQEIDENRTPLEAGLGFIVKLNRDCDFIGREVLEQQKANGVKEKLVGIELTERGVPRGGYEIYAGDEKIGVVTSGTMSPTLKKGVALGFVKKEFSAIGTKLLIDIRGKKNDARVCKAPFIETNVKRAIDKPLSHDSKNINGD